MKNSKQRKKRSILRTILFTFFYLISLPFRAVRRFVFRPIKNRIANRRFQKRIRRSAATPKRSRKSIKPHYRQTMRRRLPLSYALVAMLTAMVLGVFLLGSVNVFYNNREFAYASRIGESAADFLGPLIQETGLDSDLVEEQLNQISAVTNTRLSIFSADGERVLSTRQESGMLQVELEIDDNLQMTFEVPTVGNDVPIFIDSPNLGLAPIPPGAPRNPVPPVPVYVDPNDFIPDSGESFDAQAFEDAMATREADFEAAIAAYELVVLENEQSYQTAIDAYEERLRVFESTQANYNDEIIEEIVTQYEIPVSNITDIEFAFNQDNFNWIDFSYTHLMSFPILGADSTENIAILRVDEMADYSGDVTGAVAAAWAGASLIGVTAAALLGLFMSRRITKPLNSLTAVTNQMADGDLSARTNIKRRDELGLLGHTFNSMADRVENTVETLQRFVGDAAHELNTPITALKNTLDLAVDEDDSAEKQALIMASRTQVRRLETLAQSLLNLSQLEAEVATTINEPVDLVNMVLKTSEIYAGQAEQVGIDLRLDLPSTHIYINGDESQLKRALGNLLDNAIKFTPEGGVVTVGVSRKNEQAALWVQDTGNGVSTADMPHLFNRFHRARSSSAYPGSGLGLAIVKAIAEHHGGSVRVNNTQPGARFTILLPSPNIA